MAATNSIVADLERYLTPEGSNYAEMHPAIVLIRRALARIRELEAGMAWTDAKPTAPGVYLWRYDSMSPIDNWEIVEACLDNKFGIVRRRGSFSYAFPDGQFAGPIPMPVEPKEERK